MRTPTLTNAQDDNIANGVLKLLEQSTERYDKILFFESEDLLEEFLQSKAAKEFQGRLLALSRHPMRGEIANVTCQKITEKEAAEITALYFLYAFSDKFLFLSEKNRNYADLRNFVQTGALDMEQMFEALLH